MLKPVAYLLIGQIVLFSSCASVFNGKQQEVVIRTESDSTEIFVDGVMIGNGPQVAEKLDRDVEAKQIKVKKEGHKTAYYIHGQYKRPFTHFFSYIPFLPLAGPYVDTYSSTGWNYDKITPKYEAGPVIPERSKDQKYLYAQNTNFNVNTGDATYSYYNYKNYLRDAAPNWVEGNSESLEIDNSVFSSAVNSFLYEHNYADTTNVIIKRKTNSLLLDGEVSDLDIKEVTMNKGHTTNFVEVELEIKWSILDVYGVSQLDKKIKATSGQFSTDFYGSSNNPNVISMAVNDAITNSFLKLIKNFEVKKVMEREEFNPEEFEELTVSGGVNPTNLGISSKSAVTILSGDNGHGSGFAVSKDGYIVTNYHVIAQDMDDLRIKDDTNEIKAEVIRYSDEVDLALLKVDKEFDNPFSIPKTENFKLGQEVFAIGTPRNVQLGQTITRGIVSAVRENEGIRLLQTDVSVNPGNSGGPLVDRDGNLIGVVRSKLLGVGIEGISFVVPADQIRQFINVKN
jgi:S1-C subfamily serine protease